MIIKSKLFFIFFIGLQIFILNPSGTFAYASSGNPDILASSLALTNPLDFFKSDALKNATQDTGISTKKLSFSDIPNSLKAIGILAINLFLIVIQTVAGVLKALLPFLSK